MRAMFGKKNNLFDYGNLLFMLLLCFVTLYPFWYIIVYSFNEGRDSALGGIWFWPREFTVENYRYVLGNSLLTDAFKISILRSAIAPVLSVLVCGLAAYAVSHKNLPGKKFFIVLFMVPMFIGGTLVSNYLVIAKLGLLNQFLVYVVPAAFSFFSMVIIRSFIEQLPEGMAESARMDGAGYVTIFFKIVVPLSKPVIAAFLFFGVVTNWLDFYTNLLYVTKQDLNTLQYILYKIVRESDTAELMKRAVLEGRTVAAESRQVTLEAIKMTTIVVVTLPILVIYPFFQKYFVKGMLVGAIKE